MRLGVDPRKADQMVRGTVNLPNGTGKTARVVVFATGDKAAAAAAARANNLTGWAITNTRSSVDPFLSFGDDRAMREKVWRAFVNRGDNGDANDTNATIAEIVSLPLDAAESAALRDAAAADNSAISAEARAIGLVR